QLIETYVSQELWGDFVDILKAAAPSYIALGVSIWEGAQTRQDEKFESVGGFLNWVTFGIPKRRFYDNPKAVLEQVQAYYTAMKETPNVYTISNFATLGLPDLVVGAFNPETSLSAEHMMNSLYVLMLMSGMASTAKSMIARLKPVKALTKPVPINKAQTGKTNVGQGDAGKGGLAKIRERVQRNVADSKVARGKSNFDGYVKKEKAVLSGKKVSGAIPKKNISSLPNNVKHSYKNYKKNNWGGNVKGQTPGTKAGGSYKNREGKLPGVENSGKSITYNEYDVNNKLPNANRDSERFIKGSDGSLYYTNDHYKTFIKIE
ncbi:ribonuclease, partial [Amphibacillus marinus]